MKFNQAECTGPSQEESSFFGDSDLGSALVSAGCITLGSIGVGTVAGLAPSTLLGSALVAGSTGFVAIAGSKK